MRHGSLFSGIGGFELAAEMIGWENVFHCELNKFGSRTLKYYWPNAISYEDITKTDFSVHRGTIDILTGGFPCQPYSMAGKRLGKEDERHLWPEMLRAIREIAPRYVVGENVFGLLSWNRGLVFDEVHADLEAEGYEVQAVVVPAASVNAPHGRDRVWFVAYSNSGRWGERSECQHDKTSEWKICKNEQKEGHKVWRNFGNGSNDRIAPNTSGIERREGGVHQKKQEKTERYTGEFHTWANWRTWENFPTQYPICGRNDGLPTELDGITFSKWRAESIKAYGNAIVPQVAYQIFRAINIIENASTKELPTGRR